MELREQLVAQEERLEELLMLLQHEQNLLMQGRVEGSALETLAKSKRKCLDTLQQLEQDRRQQQLAAGFGESIAETERLALSLGEAERWERLQLLVSQTTHLNRLNGTLIMQRMLHNQRVLDDLRQLSGSSVYGADGHSAPVSGRLQTRA